MTLKPNIDLQAFMNVVQKCEGDVHFKTEEGDQLNLKSMLSQFVFASAVFGKLPNLKSTIICMEDDLPKLYPYLE